jgi:hypothetical protein
MKKKKYMVTVTNSAGDVIKHKYFTYLKLARKFAKSIGYHCIVEIWKLV